MIWSKKASRHQGTEASRKGGREEENIRRLRRLFKRRHQGIKRKAKRREPRMDANGRESAQAHIELRNLRKKISYRDLESIQEDTQSWILLKGNNILCYFTADENP